MNKTPTPHNSAKLGDFAKTVIMPGDPLRAKMIADNFLDNAKLVNNVRGIQGYTGSFQGKKISVMASGMGTASMSIYAYELFNFYEVDNIIRVGSAGAISSNLKLRDIIVALSASSEVDSAKKFELNGVFAPTCSFALLEKLMQTNTKHLHYGNILSSHNFYDDIKKLKKWQKLGVLGVEMETSALYTIAAESGKNALSICTISDCPFTSESLSSDERQNSFIQMIMLALQIAP